MTFTGIQWFFVIYLILPETDCGVDMHIVQLVQNLSMGGVETLLATISKGLRERRHRVSILCLTGGGIVAEALQSDGFDLQVVGVRRMTPGAILHLRTILRRLSPDLVHMHALPAGSFGRTALLGTGIASIYHLHTLISAAHHPSRGMILRERLLAPQTGNIIAVSREVAVDYIHTFNLAPEYLTILAGGIPDKKKLDRIETRKKLGLPGDKLIGCCVASLTPHKRHSIMLKALSLVKDVHLVLVGDGPLMEQLQQESRQSGIENRVHFQGLQKEVHPYLSASDFFLLSSFPREGMPLSVLEAGRTSIPSIVTNVGGLPEVIDDGWNGFLVNPENPEAMAEKIRFFQEQPGELIRMGTNARKRYEKRYELNAFLNRLESLYEDARQ